jgi:dTDP-4-dehydrorhamnose reductase
MPKKAFITGLSGFLGSSLAAHLAKHGWAVTGSYKEREPKLKGVDAVHLDICLPEAWARALEAAKPDVVYHLAAQADPDTCAADVAATRQINVQGARFAAQAAAAAGAKIIFTSTDQVHDGSRALSSETDPANPLGVYGRSKFDAEGLVLA